MSNVTKFESAKVPAHISKLAALFGGSNNALKTSMGPKYPVLTIRGKVWRWVEDKVQTPLVDEEGETIQSVRVVIIKANPNLSKVFYKEGYEEGSDTPPDCQSSDGIKPDDIIKTPINSVCATCPKNEWGTGKEGKGRACSDSRRIAIAPENDLSKIALLRVPAASLKNFGEFAAKLDSKGVPYQAVVTKIGFDPESASPKLVPKAVDFISDEDIQVVKGLQDDELVNAIIGTPLKKDGEPEAAPDRSVLDDDEDEPAPKAAAKTAAKPKAAAKPAPVEEEDDEVVEEAPKPAAKPKAAAKPAPAVEETDDLPDDISSMLDGLDLDD